MTEPGAADMEGRVLVTGTSVPQTLLAPLTRAGLIVDNPPELLGEDALASRLQGCVAYLLGGDEVATGTALSTAKGLKVIAFLGVGYSSFIDVAAASAAGIKVTNTPGTLTESVSEFALGQILNGVRKLGLYSDRAMRSYSLRESVEEEQKRHDLQALEVGILGLGAIGTRVAEILTKGFGSSVSYYSRTRKIAEEQRLGITFRALPDLLGSSDVLCVLTPGDEDTRNLISFAQFSSMKQGMILVNITKPFVVDPKSLLDAIKGGVVETAIFDQFYSEDVAERAELLALPTGSLVLTRHIGSLTHEAREAMARSAVSSILNVLNFGTDDCVVN